MNNNGIEDILIGASYNSTNKKKKKGIIIFFIILILILAGLIFAYFYIKNNEKSKKEVFINYLSNANIINIFSNNIYEDICNKMLTENSETTNNLKFSTNIENNTLEGIDESKFILDINTKNDINKNKSYGEIELNYSGNDILKLNYISNKNEAGLFSNEISDKYIGVHYDKIKDVFGIDFNSNEIDNILNSPKINLSTDKRNEYLKKYFNTIITNLTEEEFSVQENFLLEKDSETISVTSHTLTLTQQQLNDLLVKVLEELKNDDELINLITSDSQNERIDDEEIEEEIDDSNKFIENAINVLLGKKINITSQEFKQEIEDEINTVKNLSGDGIKLTIYANEDKVEKITIVLSEDNTIDLEILNNTDNENNIKITCLYKNNSIFNNDKTDYSREDIEAQSENLENKTNGFSLELKKVQNEASTTIDAIYSFIEDEKINKKISLNINTNGKQNSNNYKNDIVITYSSSEGEIKIILDNNINFDVNPEIEDLTEENCLFLDNLSPEELDQTKVDITNKLIDLYNNKIEEFDFLDANVHASTIDKASLNITRNEAKQALINRVSIMMREALDRNEEFTLQNLVDLSIEGYEVSSTVTESEAIVVVDVYTFRIDSDFILTDVE